MASSASEGHEQRNAAHMSRLATFAHSFQAGVPGHAFDEPVERADIDVTRVVPLNDIRRRAWFVFKGRRKYIDWLVWKLLLRGVFMSRHR